MGIIGDLRDALERTEKRLRKIVQIAYDLVFAGKMTQEDRHNMLRKIDRIRDGLEDED